MLPRTILAVLLGLMLCSQTWGRQWRSWSGWSNCSASCGPHGTQFRTRSVAAHAQCGGSNCSGPTRETRACNRICYNSGYVSGSRCVCGSGYTGTCCEKETPVRISTDRNSCDSGYSLADTGVCVDINECSFNNGGCEHSCKNNAGSFDCSCYEGYFMLDSGACVDIDECDDNNGGCAQACTNIGGSFECTCDQGFHKPDSETCQDINECGSNNGGCDEHCINTIGSFFCTSHQDFDHSGNHDTPESKTPDFVIALGAIGGSFLLIVVIFTTYKSLKYIFANDGFDHLPCKK